MCGVGLMAALAALLAGSSCADLSHTRDIRVTILDEQSHPIPGAIFYAEATDEYGAAFAFTWSKAGLAGEVPQSAREPVKLPWRRGAHLAMVAFAPGRRPAVVREDTGRVDSDGAVLELDPGSAWNADLARFAFPFEPGAKLAVRLRDPAALPLIEAFRAAWTSSPDPASAEAMRRKLDAIAPPPQ